MPVLYQDHNLQEAPPNSASPQLFHHHLLYGSSLELDPHRQSPPPPRRKRLMGESSSRQNPRLCLKSTSGLGGEIVEVQGRGHVMRTIGRKDRHSKVCTAKGPRDRRVRLAAHTAIQFYDVQDRLGYDRPSKAVDWLINKAKAAIDELAELPPWHPTNTTYCPSINFETGKVEDVNSSHGYVQDSSFLPPSLDPDDHDADDDTLMKSFFPVSIASSSAMEFQNFHGDMPSSSRNNNGSSQDLRLSLQSLQYPNMGFDGTSSNIPLGFDGNNGWLDHHERLASWNSSSGGAAEYLINSPVPPPQMLLQQLLGGHSNQFVSQRGPLQSINTPPVRAPNWVDPSTDNHGQLHHYPLSVFSTGNSSQSGGFSGFRVPARIQGDDDEEHDGYSDKPSSTSSDSRH